MSEKVVETHCAFQRRVEEEEGREWNCRLEADGKNVNENLFIVDRLPVMAGMSRVSDRREWQREGKKAKSLM